MHDDIVATVDPVTPVRVAPAPISAVAPDAAESGRSMWALLGLLLAVSAAITIMALGIAAG